MIRRFCSIKFTKISFKRVFKNKDIFLDWYQLLRMRNVAMAFTETNEVLLLPEALF
jgi:hypothetical protein